VIDAMKLFEAWDYRFATTSEAAPLFAYWYYIELPKAIFRHVVEQDKPTDFVVDFAFLRDLILDREVPFFEGTSKSEIDQILVDSLALAASNHFGANGGAQDMVQWGQVNKLNVKHPLQALIDDNTLSCANLIDRPRDGNISTLNLGYPDAEGNVQGGASVRLVIDVGKWDNSQAINMPGQSGDPKNRHYCDLTESWATGEYFQFSFSRKSVEENASLHINVRPRN
ncbi:MAG: penicillin acylase family protein, partial [Pseudomonadota bacterium]